MKKIVLSLLAAVAVLATPAAHAEGTYTELVNILDEDGTFSYIDSTRGWGFEPEPEEYAGGNVIPEIAE